MEPTFKIQSADTFPENVNLFAEINLWGVTYVVTGANNICIALISYHFPADTSFERAAVYIKQSVAAQNILQLSFDSITIVYAYPTALLVPNALMPGVDQKAVLELVYGDLNDAYIRTAFSYKQQLHTIYAVPKPVDSVVSYLFSPSVVRHQFGLLSDMLPAGTDYLYCILGNHQFTVQLTKGAKLQAIQSFNFKTPEDILYYLLQLCSTYDISPGDLTLMLSGMVDTDSPLYIELYKYFLNIQLQTLPEQFAYPEEMSQVPPHYFSNLFQSVLCVS